MEETTTIEVRDTAEGKKIFKLIPIDLEGIKIKIDNSQKRIDEADSELARHIAEHDEKVALAQSEINELQGQINLAKDNNIPIPVPADEKVDIQASDVIAE